MTFRKKKSLFLPQSVANFVEKKKVHKWLPVSAPIVLHCSWSDQGCTLHTKTQKLPLGAERRQSKTQRKSKVERNDVRALCNSYSSYSMWKIKNTCKTKPSWDEYPATWATSDISEYQIWRLGDPLVASKVQIENRFFLFFSVSGFSPISWSKQCALAISAEVLLRTTWKREETTQNRHCNKRYPWNWNLKR